MTYELIFFYLVSDIISHFKEWHQKHFHSHSPLNEYVQLFIESVLQYHECIGCRHGCGPSVNPLTMRSVNVMLHQARYTGPATTAVANSVIVWRFTQLLNVSHVSSQSWHKQEWFMPKNKQQKEMELHQLTA